MHRIICRCLFVHGNDVGAFPVTMTIRDHDHATFGGLTTNQGNNHYLRFSPPLSSSLYPSLCLSYFNPLHQLHPDHPQPAIHHHHHHHLQIFAMSSDSLAMFRKGLGDDLGSLAEEHYRHE